MPLRGNARLFREIDGDELPSAREGDALLLPVGDRAYLVTDADKAALAEAFSHASLV